MKDHLGIIFSRGGGKMPRGQMEKSAGTIFPALSSALPPFHPQTGEHHGAAAAYDADDPKHQPGNGKSLHR